MVVVGCCLHKRLESLRPKRGDAYGGTPNFPGIDQRCADLGMIPKVGLLGAVVFLLIFTLLVISGMLVLFFAAFTRSVSDRYLHLKLIGLIGLIEVNLQWGNRKRTPKEEIKQ
jgi:hypothetical protein